MKTIYSFILCLIILSLNIFINCVKLNERRILLPFNNGVNTNFTLEATNDNCYQWSSSRVDVASVEPLDEGKSCSRKALVTVVSTNPKRQSTVVAATNTASGSVIRCDVEVDVIDSIEIITTSHEIVLEDLPEILEVKAKNDKNDTFTSIGGIQFEWTLSPVDVLRYRTWSSSSYVAPSYVNFWEAREAKGPAILVEGIRTGSAKVVARIVGDEYKNVKPAVIELHVIANLGLIPPNVVYLMKGSKIQFKAEMAKQGPRVALPLPSPQYYLKVLDETIADLNEENSQVEALKDGQTSLLLLDRNVASGQTSRHPTTDIHVMRPSYISIHVTPGENFALCEFTNYVVSFTIHDDWHHRLYPAENLILKVTFPSRYFDVNESSINGTFHVIRTINSGNSKITAQLLGAGTARLPTPLELSQEVTVYRSLVLTPYLILLPSIPSVKPSYTVRVTASGATGQYRWGTNNSQIATVTYKQEMSSAVTVVTKGEGEALINCQDVHNSVFSSNMRISIQPLVDIQILPAVLETHVGGSVILPIAVYGYESDSSKTKRLFDDCSQIPFDVEIIEKTRVKYDSKNIMPGMGTKSCRSLSFECISTGNTRVWIRYKENGKELLTTSALIGCHLPLRPVHPEEWAVLPLGGIIDVAFEGGPRAWSLHPEGHYAKLTSDDSIVSSVEVKDRYRYNKDLNVFRIKCLEYGETPLELDVGNLASPTLPNPATAKTKVQIICGRPSSLVIKPKLESSCPLSAPQESVFPIQRNKDAEIEVVVNDEKGRPFYNITTLNIIWKMEGSATFETNNGVKEIVNGAKGYFAITRNIQILREIRSNSVKISAEITGYKKEFKNQFKIKSEIDLVSVDKAKTDSDNIAIFNHPEEKSVVNIQRGSGYFSIDSETERQFINISFKPQSKSFTIVPKAIGGGVIGINDLCLNFPKTEIYYSVVEAIDIRIEILDKFQFGTVVEGFVSVVDNNGDYIRSENHKLIDLVPIVSNGVLSISNLSKSGEWKSSFKVKGERLGSSSLSFVSRSTLINTIESSAVNIQVFAPLRIVPSNLTLIVGDYFQVTTVGGPQPQRNIEFSLNDEKIATVDSNGLIVGSKLGKTKLIARILSVENIEYSRSEVEINVVALNKIKIISPTSNLRIGSKIPLHLMGGNEFETPFSFGTGIPSLRITWSLSNDNIAAIDQVFQNSGVVDQNSDSISIRVLGISTGVVSIKVTVESKAEAKESSHQQIAGNKVLSDTIQIHVFPSFAIVSDHRNIEEKEILMSPNSQLSLQSNRVGEADTQFELFNNKNIKLGCGPERCIKAGESPEVSSLVVKTSEKSGVTLTSVFGIRVEKISYLMVNLINNFVSGETIDVFPIGSEAQIRVTFHDNIGKTFDSIRSQIRWTLSRNDLIRISRGSDNTTLKIKSLKEGRTLVKVFDSENFFDYFTVDVGAVIEPNNLKISVGEVICFQSRLTSKSGVWSNENPSVGDIDRETGIFVSRNGGHTLVEWKSSHGLTTYTSVDVMPPKRFALNTRRFKGITNSMSQSIPIVIINQNEEITQRHCSASIDLSSLDSIQSPFNCEITFDNSLQIKSVWNIGVAFDMNSGQWLCRFDPKPDLKLNEMSLINGNVSISVIMSAPTRDLESNYNPLIHTISVPFLPAFDVSPKQLILSPDQSEGRISVHSVPIVLEDLTIISSNNEIIETSNSEIIGNSMKVIISVKNWDIFSNDVSNLHISLNSKITKQSQRIPIQIKLFGHNIQQISSSHKFFRDNGFTIISTIVFGIAIIVVFIKYLKPKVTSSPTTLPLDPSSPFMSDSFGSPSLKGHRALNYTPPQLSTPVASSPRVGRPLYSVPKT